MLGVLFGVIAMMKPTRRRKLIGDGFGGGIPQGWLTPFYTTLEATISWDG